MTMEIRVPPLGESVSEVTVGQWLKKPGDTVAVDEPLVELETDKVTQEIRAQAAGVLTDILAKTGAKAPIGALLGTLREGAAGETSPTSKTAAQPTSSARVPKSTLPDPVVVSPPQKAPALAPSAMPPSPAARKKLAEIGWDADSLAGSGRRGQLLKHDIVEGEPPPAPRTSVPAPVLSTALSEVATAVPAQILRLPSSKDDSPREERIRMTRLRQTIARRLKDAQNTAAMLTTFNDVDMSAVMKLRADYKEAFEKRHGIKLGFMGLFVRACLQALKEIPVVNAEIDGDEVVYKNYYHIGVAVGTDRGLVVPVVHDADRRSLAEIETYIADAGRRAREGKLAIEEMQGGTFTITNGGVYGSLMSTPILNAPQSGILGMHRIEDRPVVKGGAVVVRPMMYLALSYDHRIVDGREAVTFLMRVKECLEDPQRFVLDL